MRRILWFHYDDVKNHKIVASKQEWDYFNRLILLLESDGDLEMEKTSRRWRLRQVLAAVCLSSFALVVYRTGLGQHLFIYAMPFGVVSMLIAWFDERRQRRAATRAASATTPFPSVGSLLSVRRQVPGFTRTRYPGTVASRKLRNPFIEKVMWFLYGGMWLVLSPVPLFLQILPEKVYETQILMPEPPASS